MNHNLTNIQFNTDSAVQFIDITDRVKDACAKSGIQNGLLNVFTRHTTTALKINEKCDRLQKDMLAFLETAVPAKKYQHDTQTVDGRENARSHLMSLLLNASETVPLSDGKLALGDWQSVFFIELDGPRENRNVAVSIIGE